MERSEQPEVYKGKFASPRDEALYRMCYGDTGGWADRSTGDDQEWGANYWLVVNKPADIAEIVQAFEDEFTAIGIFDPSVLVGNFVVGEDSYGDVKVASFLTDYEAEREFERLDEEYKAWQVREEWQE